MNSLVCLDTDKPTVLSFSERFTVHNRWRSCRVSYRRWQLRWPEQLWWTGPHLLWWPGSSCDETTSSARSGRGSVAEESKKRRVKTHLQLITEGQRESWTWAGLVVKVWYRFGEVRFLVNLKWRMEKRINIMSMLSWNQKSKYIKNNVWSLFPSDSI